MRIAPEGLQLLWLPFAGCVICLGAGVLLGLPVLRVVGGVVLLVFLLALFFFRDPEREIPKGENLILAPCDGKVIVAQESHEQGERGRVAVFMSILDVHVNRNPITGIVRKIERSRGKYHHAGNASATQENTSVSIEATTNFGAVTWIQVAGSLARRISCRLKEGQQVLAGDRFGLIYLGSRMEVLLPSEVRIKVKLGQHVKAGTTVLGEVQ
jgi:phosphatidylserine decarboxylase